MIKKIRFTFAFIVTLFSSNLFAESLVYNKVKFNAVYGLDENGEEVKIVADHLRGKFTFIWFFHTSCPYCKKSLPELKKVIDYIDLRHEDDINVMLTSIKPSNLEELREYFSEVYLEDKVVSYLNEFEMINYMNLESTPTLIIMDPKLNIVDKIENATNSSNYIKHIQYIISKWKEAHNL